MEQNSHKVKVEINGPVEEVFYAYHNVPDHPKWSPWLCAVDWIDYPQQRTKWSLRKYGISLSFQAENRTVIPPREISWESLDGLISQSGFARFHPLGDTRCVLELTVTYSLPRVISAMFRTKWINSAVETTLRGDLERFNVFFVKHIKRGGQGGRIGSSFVACSSRELVVTWNLQKKGEEDKERKKIVTGYHWRRVIPVIDLKTNINDRAMFTTVSSAESIPVTTQGSFQNSLDDAGGSDNDWTSHSWEPSAAATPLGHPGDDQRTKLRQPISSCDHVDQARLHEDNAVYEDCRDGLEGENDLELLSPEDCVEKWTPASLRSHQTTPPRLSPCFLGGLQCLTTPPKRSFKVNSAIVDVPLQL